MIEIDGPKYWTGKRDKKKWSYDPRDAVLFLRKQDAEAVRYWTLNLTDAYGHVTELVNHGH